MDKQKITRNAETINAKLKLQASLDAMKDRYLAFRIADEMFAVGIKEIIEIIGIYDITELPDVPIYVKGVINLRGKVVPVVDVRTRFMIPEIDYGPRTCIIIVGFEENLVGLIVDEVAEVVNIDKDHIDPPPKTKKKTESRFLKGVGKIGKDIKYIIDVSELLSKESDNSEIKEEIIDSEEN